MLSHLPLSAITSFVAVILVIVFFCTSSDSGSLVIDTITAGGKVDAPVAQRVFWAVFEGLVAVALPLGGGDAEVSERNVVGACAQCRCMSEREQSPRSLEI